MANPPPNIRWAIFIALSLLALAVRLPQLGERPMHTDESVNAFITGKLLAGGAFHYDSQDRHGPALFVLAAPLAKLTGAKNFSELTESQLRLTPVIVGCGTVLLFGAGVEMFGFIACLIAALLFAIAPLPVYYSRYFIHETLFVAATLGLIFSGGRLLKTSSTAAAATAGFCAALMFACKETAVIHFFALGFAMICGRLFKPAGEKLPAQKILGIAIGVFIFTSILMFTWMGRNWSAFFDLLQAVPRFAARAGGEGHEKSFGYYFQLLDPLLILFLLAATGIYAVICDAITGIRRQNLLLTIYGLVVFLIYAAIPYKTPWLALNLWLPLALVCGFGVNAFWEQTKSAGPRWGVVISGIFLLATLASQTQTLVFYKPADEKNPYAYAHTSEDLLGLPVRLNALARENKLTRPRIAVVAKDAWPLPWYLRTFPDTGFWQPDQETGDADFFITTTDVSGKLAERLKNYRPEFFGARPNVLLILWTPPKARPAHE